ncbi:MAG: hypothetical protein WCL24_08755 [Verrucomicrobiota bacterium]|nr:hypothetical protein [Opitutales bacterium]
MNRSALRSLGLVIALLVLLGICLVFPRALAFVELAARELRYLWWLVLILALGIWLAFFFGRKRD